MQVFAPLNSEAVPLLQKIEVATFFQLPSFQIIGLPSPEVAEARERIRSAIETTGIEFPKRRMILNLSPASIRKRGTGLDLAMALAILGVQRKHEVQMSSLVAWGELGLDGSVKPMGQLTRGLYATWRDQISYFILSNLEYSKAIQSLQVIDQSHEMVNAPPVLIPVQSLGEAWSRVTQLSNHSLFEKMTMTQLQQDLMTSTQLSSQSSRVEGGLGVDSNLILLPPILERMIGIAVAGKHHLLLLGPRGSGKSHACEWLIALQPPASAQDRLQQFLLAELRGFTPNFIRRVGINVRPGSLVGGVSSGVLRPGEFSLAHGGLFVADEWPEWHRDSREVFREPLESQWVTITRIQGTVRLPARFVLVANGNFCPCGGWPPELPTSLEEAKLVPCRCSYGTRRHYLDRFSGPLLDRMDIVIFSASAGLSALSPGAGSSTPEQTKDSVIQRLDFLKEKIQKTRETLIQTWGDSILLGSGSYFEKLLDSRADWRSQLKKISITSYRSKHKIIKIALTLAAWDETIEPSAAHFFEASCYRPERLFFLNGAQNGTPAFHSVLNKGPVPEWNGMDPAGLTRLAKKNNSNDVR